MKYRGSKRWAGSRLRQQAITKKQHQIGPRRLDSLETMVTERRA